MTLPEKTESTMVGSMEACAKAAVVATAPSSVAEKPLKEPPKLPISFCIEAERSLSSESFFRYPDAALNLINPRGCHRQSLS